MNGYRFVYTMQVRFADLDALRHVNNATFLTFLESARLAYWLHVTRRSGLEAFDLILARVELDFRAPLFFDEAIEIGVRCASMRRSSFVLELRVEEQATRRLAAEARKVCVYYDFAASRSLPIPDAIRAQLRAQDPELREDA